MVGWIILGIIMFVILLIMLIPIGADIGYESGELRVSAKICGLLLQLIPKEPVDETKPKKDNSKKKQKKKENKPEDELNKKSKRKLNFNKDELLGLVKAALRGFGKFGRRLKVDRFLFHYVAGGKDPYSTAMNLGCVNAALSTLYPLCARRFDVKDSSVWTDADFTAEKMKVDFGVAATIRIGQIFAMINTILFGALGILIKNKWRLFKEKYKAGKNKEQNINKVIDIKDIKKENIQVEERTDSNG